MIKEEPILMYYNFTQYLVMVLIRDMEDAVVKIKMTENSDEVLDREECYKNKWRLFGNLYIFRTCIKIKTILYEDNRYRDKEELIKVLSEYNGNNSVIYGKYRKNIISL